MLRLTMDSQVLGNGPANNPPYHALQAVEAEFLNNLSRFVYTMMGSFKQVGIQSLTQGCV